MTYPMHLYKDGKLGATARYIRTDAENEAARSDGYKELVGFQQYPKHLYLNAERTAEDCVVRDEKEEKAARKKGFKMLSEAGEEAKAE